MTGKEKMDAAFSAGGTTEVPVVLPYDALYFRDHWDDVTSHPWWHQYDPDADVRAQCIREATLSTGQDWVRGRHIEPSSERRNTRLEVRSDGVFTVDFVTGQETELQKPLCSGQDEFVRRLEEERYQVGVNNRDQVDQWIPLPASLDPSSVMIDGRGEMALSLFKDLDRTHYPFMHVPTPLWRCYRLWGFEELMVKIATEPELVPYACQRYMELCVRQLHEAAILGVSGIWLEEAFTDMISPAVFRALNVGATGLRR